MAEKAKKRDRKRSTNYKEMFERQQRDTLEKYKEMLEQNRRDTLETYKDKPELARTSFQLQLLDLLVKYGMAWVPAPLDERFFPRGPEQQCYKNAMLLAMKRPWLSYVEGDADWRDHAWCVDSKGNVVDPTWPKDIPLPKTYFGVAFKTEWVWTQFSHCHQRTGKFYFGVIFNNVSRNPALSAEPDEMLDPRWYEHQAGMDTPIPVSRSSTWLSSEN